MSLNDACAFAYNLAVTLMVAIIIFRAGDGTLSVTPCNEFDADAEIVAEIDPFDVGRLAEQLRWRRSVRFPLPKRGEFDCTPPRALVVVDGAPVRPILTEATSMIVFAILGLLAAIGVLCWLLFTLAVFALPAFIGVSAGIWAHECGTWSAPSSSVPLPPE